MVLQVGLVARMSGSRIQGRWFRAVSDLNLRQLRECAGRAQGSQHEISWVEEGYNFKNDQVFHRVCACIPMVRCTLACYPIRRTCTAGKKSRYPAGLHELL